MDMQCTCVCMRVYVCMHVRVCVHAFSQHVVLDQYWMTNNWILHAAILCISEIKLWDMTNRHLSTYQRS